MKKKLILILIVALALSTQLFAAPRQNKNYKAHNYSRGKDMGLGLNLGYPGSGLAIRYHNDDFRALGAVSFLYSNALAVDFTGEYIFARIECDDKARHMIDLSAGIGAGAVIPFGGDAFAVAFEAGLIANYDIPDTDFSLFLRGLWRPTLVFADSGLYFDANGFAGSLGFTYNFPLK